MEITLIEYIDKNIRVVKSIDYFGAVTVRNDCTIRNPLDVLKPVIFLEFDETIKDITYNYCFIPCTNRFYYISNKIRLANKLWEFHLTVDVLNSYQEDIKKSYAFIARNENNFNPMIIDSLCPLTKEKEIYTHTLSNNGAYAHLINTTFNVNQPVTSWNIMVVTNDVTDYSNNDIPAIPNTKLPGLFRMYSNVLSNYWIINSITDGDLNKFMQDSAVNGFIKSIVAYPCTLLYDDVVEDEIEPMMVNKVNSYIKARKPKYSPSYYMITHAFKYSLEDESFFNREPFTSYELYIPFVGYIEINAHDLINKEYILIYEPNFEDGSAAVILYNMTDGCITYQNTCQLGVSIGLSQSNEREITVARAANTLNLISGFQAAATSKNPTPAGVAGNVMNATVNYAINDAYNFVKGNAYVSSGITGLLSPMQPFIKITKSCRADNSYNTMFPKLFGKPLNAVASLTELTGFTIVNEIQLNNIKGATDVEIQEIERLLKQGVIL